MTEHDQLLRAMEQSVIEGNQQAAEACARDALSKGMAPLRAVEEGFVAGLRKAGVLWEEGEFFLPELVTAAQAMKAAMAILQPALEGNAQQHGSGRVVIGTVQGDIHDIGKTLVATLLSANGFTVDDLGAEVPVERFVDRARAGHADLVCASALLTTTMTVQRDLVQAIRAAGLPSAVIVGGAPVTRTWAEQIGADGYADNAISAVEEARKLVHRARA